MMIALTGGGTGGHVFPALSVAAALRDPGCIARDRIDLTYIGLRQGPEARLAAESGLEFHAVSAGAMRGRHPLAMIASAVRLAIGTLQARRALGAARVGVVLATGGYVTVPVALAARLLRIPLVVYLPDVEPGWAVRFTARLAHRIATTNEQAAAHLPGSKTVVTGYPVRPEFRTISRTEARRRMGVSEEETLLLVTGASQGAQRVNEEIGEHLETLLRLCRLVHVTGPAHHEQFERLREGLPSDLRSRYTVRGFMDDLPVAMRAADLAVMRAGASTLGELPAARLAAILVPYPYAGAHQRHNADYLAEQGAAVVLDEEEIGQLHGLVEALLSDAPRRQEMARRLEALDRPNAACDIARLVVSAAGGER